MTRLALSALLATLALLGVAPRALAHTELVSSDPANGASVPQRPAQLTLTFSEPVPAESATVTVIGPDGSAWPLGDVAAAGATLTVPLLETAAPAGRYEVDWLVESLDGDFVDGTFAFTLTAPQTPTTTPPITAPVVTSTDDVVVTATQTSPVDSITLAVTPRTSDSAAAVQVDDDVPLWVWILVVAVLAVVGIAVAVALNRRAAGPDTEGDAEKPAE